MGRERTMLALKAMNVRGAAQEFSGVDEYSGTEE